jgi:hypothetical protein
MVVIQSLVKQARLTVSSALTAEGALTTGKVHHRKATVARAQY